jgi:tetratricopeptide (TPR) repeat protein
VTPLRWANDPDARNALALYTQAESTLADHPDHPRALRDLATAAVDLERWEVAAGALAQLVRIDGTRVDTHLDCAAVLMRLGRWMPATDVLEAALETWPDEGRLWYNLAIARQAMRHLGAARRAWDRAAALMPDNPDAYAHRGEVLLDQHLWTLAEADFRRAIAYDQGAAGDADADGPGLAASAREADVALRLNLALSLEKQGRIDDARDELLPVLATHPNHLALLNRLAQLHAVLCEIRPADATACADALRYCRQSLDLSPDQPDVTQLRADLAQRAGR